MSPWRTNPTGPDALASIGHPSKKDDFNHPVTEDS
jgi:hypothetical protein